MIAISTTRSATRRWPTLVILLCLSLCLSCAKLARSRLEKNNLAFDADTMVSVAAEGATRDVKLFLSGGMSPDVEGRTKDSYVDITPLMAAARGCHAEVGKLLLSAGADVAMLARHRESVLHATAEGCADAPVERARNFATMLLEAGAEIDAVDSNHETALIRALTLQNLGVVAVLVERGANLRMRGQRGLSAIELTREERGNPPEKGKRHEEIARIVRVAADRATTEAASLLPKEARKRLSSISYAFAKEGMVSAAAGNDIEALQLFLILGAPREWRAAALVQATQSKRREAIALMLDKGVKPGIETLFAAIEGGEIDLLRLISRSGDVDFEARSPFGSSPLTAAAERGWLEAVELLLEAGAKPNEKDNHGRNALLAATQSPTLIDDDRIVRLLIARGVEVNVAGSGKISPAYLAASQGAAEVLQALIDAGANLKIGSGPRGSVLEAALQSSANRARKERTLGVIYAVLDGWSETERIQNAKTELSWIVGNTSFVIEQEMNPESKSARITIGGSGLSNPIPHDRLPYVCHEIAGSFGLGCSWLDRIDAYSDKRRKLGEFRFDRIRGWSFVPRH